MSDKKESKKTGWCVCSKCGKLQQVQGGSSRADCADCRQKEYWNKVKK